jgi:hypothetical protein
VAPVTTTLPSRLNEKQQYTQPSPSHEVLPPVYPGNATQPALATTPYLCVASATYDYRGTDAGDLTLQPQDRIHVTEYVNQDWWRGQNQRTGATGIFPANYVQVTDKEQSAGGFNSNGNMPMDVAQGQGGPANGPPSKFQEHGKKFGKKLGNAAIFGAVSYIELHITSRSNYCRVRLSVQTSSMPYFRDAFRSQ